MHRQSHKKLNKQQLRFVAEYLKDHDGMAAAIRAGYTKTHAGIQAHALLLDVRIKAALRAKIQTISDLKPVTIESIVAELKDIGFNRNLKPANRMQALQLLGKYLGMWKEEASEKPTRTERREIIMILLKNADVTAQIKAIYREAEKGTVIDASKN